MDDNKQPEPTIGRLAQDRIGRELRALYGSLIEQPLPDGVSAVLGALDDFETARNRLQDAVQSLRTSATDPNPAVTQGSAGLSVHAQQMLVTNAMLRGRPPRRASRHRPRADRAGR
ncbi:MAG TPA: NepR family anti-sigma factor [Beijerinckiaceae bacterium]